jgi:protein phosphatase
MMVRSVGLSDQGCVRAENQDAWLYNEPPLEDLARRGVLAAVADGVGGAVAGHVASMEAIQALRESYYRADGDTLQEALVAAVQEANNRLHCLSQERSEYSGMGTTCTALAICGTEAVFAHVGDSRLYLFRCGELRQLTEDHTLVWDLVKHDVLSKLEAEQHPQKHMITRALGSHRDIEVDAGTLMIEAGDCFLICSDGLTGLVSDEEIAAVLASKPLEEAGRALVGLAKDRGGHDNITVQVLLVDTETEEAGRATREMSASSGRWKRWNWHWIVWLGFALGSAAMAVLGFLWVRS